MAVTKIRKMSSWTLLVVSLISIVVLGMFFGGGITNPGEEMKEYVYTGLLLNWTTGLFFVTIGCMGLFAIWQFVNLLKVNPKSAVAALGVVVAFVAMLFITYSIGDGTPLQGLIADSQKYNTVGWLKITDMWINSSIVLMVLIIIAVVAGSVKKSSGLIAANFGRKQSLPIPRFWSPFVMTARLLCSDPAAGIVRTAAKGRTLLTWAFPEKKSQGSPS